MSTSTNPALARFPQMPDWLQALTRLHLRTRSYPAGTTLRQQGEVDRSVLVLIEGRVKSASFDLDGREVVFGRHEPGDFVGDLDFDGQPSVAALVALEPGRCAVFTRVELEMSQALYPELRGHLLQQSQRTVRALQVQVARMALMSVQQRVYALLQDLALPAPGLPLQPLREQLRQSDMAARIGCTREMVGRAISTLIDEGRIARRERQIMLVNTERRPVVVRHALPV